MIQCGVTVSFSRAEPTQCTLGEPFDILTRNLPDYYQYYQLYRYPRKFIFWVYYRPDCWTTPLSCGTDAAVRGAVHRTVLSRVLWTADSARVNLVPGRSDVVYRFVRILTVRATHLPPSNRETYISLSRYGTTNSSMPSSVSGRANDSPRLSAINQTEKTDHRNSLSENYW